jgi:hypothetical protein
MFDNSEQKSDVTSDPDHQATMIDKNIAKE